MPGAVQTTEIGTLDADERQYRVSVRIAHDGIEYIGRLWFTDIECESIEFLDRGVIPGRTEDEVLERAYAMSDDELALRFRRGNAEKRRYHSLRRLTTNMLDQIRYMNRVAVSLRKGLLDVHSARQEMELTERQIHEIVSELRHVAGVEG